MMGKRNKGRGHFCIACSRVRANEKFSGKGHRQHICKECKRKGIKVPPPISRSEHDRKVNQLSRTIKKCLILHTLRSSFFLFDYQGRCYITRDDFESEIFLFQKNSDQHFVIDETFLMSEPLLEVLYNKYYDTMENGNAVEYDDILVYDVDAVSNKSQKHVEVILSLNNLE